MQNKWAQQSKREKKSTVDEFRGTCTSTSSKILLLYNKEALDTYQTVYNNINHRKCVFLFIFNFVSFWWSMGSGPAQKTPAGM